MRLRTRPQRRPTENVVPLINVVFLLLVFFMLTGSLRPAPFPDISLPRLEAREARDEQPQADPAPIVALSASGSLWFEEVPVSSADLARRLRETSTRALSLRADATTPAGALLSLLEDLENAGVEQVDLAVDVVR